MAIINLDTRILVEYIDDVIFCGTREQFMDCFFSNADDEEIKDWCFDNGYKLMIDDEIIFE